MIKEDSIYITYIILTITSLVSLYALKNKAVFYRLILHPVSILTKREYYRLITSGFVHNSLPHLFLNLFMLFIFCSGLEESTSGSGKAPVIIIFFSSLLCGHLLPLIIHRKDLSYSSAGASGAIFGCMCSYLLFHPYDSLLSIPLLGAIPNIYTVIGYMAVLLILSKKFNHGSIDYSIHLGGGAGGLLPAMIMYPELLPGIIA